MCFDTSVSAYLKGPLVVDHILHHPPSPRLTASHHADKAALLDLVNKVSRHVEMETTIVFDREAKLLKFSKKEAKAATSKMTLASIEAKVSMVMRLRHGRGPSAHASAMGKWEGSVCVTEYLHI